MIGFYDGLIGPGTGSFLIIALVSAMGYAFLEASAKAKIVNMATNAGALLFFLPHGSCCGESGWSWAWRTWPAATSAPGRPSSRGAQFIRIVFLAVVGALIIKLGADIWQENFA